MLDEFCEPFAQALKVAETKMPADAATRPARCARSAASRWSSATARRPAQFLGCSGYPGAASTSSRARASTRASRAGGDRASRVRPAASRCCSAWASAAPFLGCSGYPECKTTMNFDAEGKPVLSAKPTEHVCEKCGKPMVLREGPRGPFLACTGYPKCKNAKDVDAEGNPVKPIDTGHRLREVRRADGGQARPARAVPGLQRLSQVPQHQAGARGAEGEAQGR